MASQSGQIQLLIKALSLAPALCYNGHAGVRAETRGLHAEPFSPDLVRFAIKMGKDLTDCGCREEQVCQPHLGRHRAQELCIPTGEELVCFLTVPGKHLVQNGPIKRWAHAPSAASPPIRLTPQVLTEGLLSASHIAGV